MISPPGARPVVVAVAGPNGAGKTTFYEAHLRPAGLRFVNADILAKGLRIDAYAAAAMAEDIRSELIRQRESFIFETVFSDPAGAKIEFLKSAARAGYSTVLCFVGLSSAGLSEQRVAMRVSQAGHDVPGEKLRERYPRTLANLAIAIRELPHVRVCDNSDLRQPFRQVGVFESGRARELNRPVPGWLRNSLTS